MIKITPNSIEISNPTKDEMVKLGQIMRRAQDEWIDQIKKIAKDYGVSDECASDVWYGRSRSWWTHELEQKLLNASPLDYSRVQREVFNNH